MFGYLSDWDTLNYRTRDILDVPGMVVSGKDAVSAVEAVSQDEQQDSNDWQAMSTVPRDACHSD